MTVNGDRRNKERSLTQRDKERIYIAQQKGLSSSFRGIKPVSALDLFHGLLDRPFFMLCMLLPSEAPSRFALHQLTIMGGTNMEEQFAVTYLEHSLFHGAVRKTENMSKTVLIQLLTSGMISVLEVRAIIGGRQS